jgi:DNA (cytosine-5)-methyltransferase 1
VRIGSLFSGIGGLELGLEWAGVGHTVWQVEFNPFCRDVLAKHWPDVPRFNDVREVGAHNLEPVDVICGGYPCQPFSGAGKREGSNDPRHLWPEFARILRELRPRYAVLENVADHLSLGFGDVLGDLSDLGYDAEWSVVSACAVGAPHPRHRVFVVAYPTGGRRSEVLREHAEGSDTTSVWADGATAPLDTSCALARRHTWAQGVGEPPLLGMAHGLPHHVDRLAALGNAVVPQVAEVVGRRLLAVHAERSR